jgi:tRNA N6-adenosine threonylcarbamoyltransferase
MDLILGIESSCDETAAAVVADGCEVRGNVVSSQIAKHAPYGGVVPELAAREHLENIQHVTSTALSEAGVKMSDISAVSVTNGPGLLPALLVGLNFAKGIAASNELPLIGINHFIAHIYGSFLESGVDELKQEKTYPIIALVVSGGHTALVLVQQSGKAEIIGSTLDDAAGEAFDKAAKLLNLGYPGGPVIEKTATKGNSEKFHFPRALTGAAGKPLAPENRFNFSFSGVKTSLLYHCRKYGLIHPDGDMTNNVSTAGDHSEELLFDTVASYQEALVDVLTSKTCNAVTKFAANTVIICGGVACNTALREKVKNSLPAAVNLKIASPRYCTDNAAMIAGLGWHYFKQGYSDDLSLDVFSRLPSTEMQMPWGM